MYRSVSGANRISLEEYEGSEDEPGYRTELQRGPDVAFVRRARVPAEPPQSFWPFGPDLAVEVVSPGNSISELQQKVIDYFDAGALVWVIEPNIRTATVYRSLTDIAILREHETLDGGKLLPGFTIALSELFAW